MKSKKIIPLEPEEWFKPKISVSTSSSAGGGPSVPYVNNSVPATPVLPLTTLPQTGSVILDINPDSLNGTLSDGAEVLSITDTSPSAIVGTSTPGLGFNFKTNIANGHSSLRPASTAKTMSLGRPAALVTPMTDAGTWSLMVVFANPLNVGSFASLFGDYINKLSGTGISLGAITTGVIESGGNTRSFSSGDPSTNVHTLIYSGYAGADTTSTKGRLFLDGTMYLGTYPLKCGTGVDPIRLGSIADSAGGAVNNRSFTGDILRVIVWNKGISPSEAWQADSYARNYYGKALATVGLTHFPVFDGDSQTMGTGATPDTSMPAKTAALLSLKNGQYGNTGKPGATVKTGTNGNNNMTDSAPQDVDGWHTVTNLPIVIIAGEWANQGIVGGTTAAGITLADNNRTYATLRKAADPTCKLVGWTSTANKSSQGGGRDGFNASLVSTPGNFDSIVPIHTDTNIGIDGALGTPGVPTAVTADGIHLNGTGTAYHAALLAPVVSTYL